MSTAPITERLIAAPPGLRDQLETNALFGQVMALVAVTIGFTAAGAYIGGDLGGGWGLAAFVLALVAVLGLNVAATRSHSLGSTMLFALRLGRCSGPSSRSSASRSWRSSSRSRGPTSSSPWRAS